MKQPGSLLIAVSILAFAISSQAAEPELMEYRGVVTAHLIPAKVMQINKIIENPRPGTSYIGKESILVEVEENPDIRANWTVVDVKYYKYRQPKVIKYKIFSESHEITVNYHAVSVEIDGDLSPYLEEQL